MNAPQASHLRPSVPLMTFHFEKIGPVDSADIALGDLTIIAGRNNTGKTYLVYALYGFFKRCESWPGTNAFFYDGGHSHSVAALDLPRIAKALAESGHASVAVAPDVLKDVRRRLVEELARGFPTYVLPAPFTTMTEAFPDARMSMDLNGRGASGDLPAYVEARARPGGRAMLEYDGKELALAIDYEKPVHERDVRRRALEDAIGRLLLRFFCSEFPPPFMLSAYTRGVHESHEEKSFLADDNLFDHLKNMMGGDYRASREGVTFRSEAHKERRSDIPLRLVSSSARGLADLYFHLRHKAAKGDLLIIEEPESHLDTANQVLMARILARLAGAGIKVLITTHSDSIIKEVNNLLMLGQLDRYNRVVRALDYAESERLTRSSVRAYVAGDHTLACSMLDEFGIDMPVFDDTIDAINRVSRALAAAVHADHVAN